MNKLKFLCVLSAILFGVLFFAGDSWAATYYVSPSGAASWSQCTNINTPCSLSTANTNAAAGDTVYLRGGTYNIANNGIAPSNNGSSYSNRIIFSSYNGESVTFVGGGPTSQGIFLSSKQWIKVVGITFNNFTYPMLITESSHNEVSYSTFNGFYGTATISWVGSRIRSGSTYNHIHHNTFQNYGYFTPNDESVVFGVGIEESTTDDTHYNLIEDNHFAHGGHHVVEFNGYQNVLRNNYIRNDAWSNYGGTLYGNRVTFTAGQWPYIGRNLLERNRIAYGSGCADEEIGGSGGTIASQYNIIRKNMFYQNGIYGFKLEYYPPASRGSNNKIYNNVFWRNGYTATETVKANWHNLYSHGLYFDNNDSDVQGNVVKNNIFYDNRNLTNPNEPIVSAVGSFSLQVISGNSKTQNPQFVDISGIPNPTNSSQWNFQLQSNSPAIDAGEFLTAITSSHGSGTSFTVADASFFFDGWTMATNIPSAINLSGDLIQLQGQTQVATITSINYNTNTITVDAPLSWAQGQRIALAYSGTAPDQGAYEHVGTVTQVPTPTFTPSATTTPVPAPTSAARRGDLNNDNRVDVMDLGILLSNWNLTSWPSADINQDERVDVIDLGILLSSWS